MGNKLVQGIQNRPIPIEALGSSATKFDAIRRNIDTLWNRLNDLINNQTQILTQVASIQSTVDSILVSSGITLNEVIIYLRSKNIDWDDMVPTVNAEKDPTQRLWKRNGITIVTETLTYNQYGHISTQVFVGEINETRTYTYDTDNTTITRIQKT